MKKYYDIGNETEVIDEKGNRIEYLDLEGKENDDYVIIYIESEENESSENGISVSTIKFKDGNIAHYEEGEFTFK